MGRNLDPKCRQCRRAGEKLFLKGEKCFTAKCPLVKRNYPPGMHGLKGKPRISEFGRQLKEKQKAKAMYRILEKQFYGYYQKAIKSKANTGEEIIRFLECRLDNVIYRLGITISRDQARQLVSHKEVLVNGKSLSVPSHLMKIGDKISLKSKALKLPVVKESLSKRKSEVPEWLDFNPKEMTGQIINLPTGRNLEVGLDTRLIVEYYSR